jgi:hypothetical protein
MFSTTTKLRVDQRWVLGGQSSSIDCSTGFQWVAGPW